MRCNGYCGVHQRKVFIPVILLIFFSFQLCAEKRENLFYKVDSWDNDKGLAGNYIYQVVQGPEGFLWIATQEGVQRFDGIEFELFNKENTPAIKANHIKTLAMDSNGRLWIGTSGGLAFYHKRKFSQEGIIPDLASMNVNCVRAFSDKELFAGGQKGLFFLNDKSFKRIQGLDVKHFDNIRDIEKVGSGLYWLAVRNEGVFVLAGSGGQYRFVKRIFREYQVNDILFNSPESIFLATNSNGILETDPVSHRIKGKPLDFKGKMNSVMRDSRGRFWAGDDFRGLLTFSNESYAVFNNMNGLSSGSVKSVYEDPEGNIWASTPTGGINRLKEVPVRMIDDISGIRNSYFCVFLDSSGRLWGGTMGRGAFCFTDGKVINYSTEDGLGSDDVNSICESSDKTIFLGTYDQGISVLKNGKIRGLSIADKLSSSFVRVLHNDSKDRLWIGYQDRGLDCADKGKVVNYNTENGLASNTVSVIFEDSRQDMWIGTMNNGLCRISSKGIERFGKEQGLTASMITAISEDSEGSILVGTYEEGLFVYSHGTFFQVNNKNGLYDNVVYTLAEDNYGYLWMTSNKGIFKAKLTDIKDVAFKRINSFTGVYYGPDQGLESRECNGTYQPAFAKNSAGALFFPTVKGIAKVRCDSNVKSSVEPLLVVRKVLLNGDVLENSKKYILDSQQRDIQIDYAGLSFRSPGKVHFSYILKGFERKWHSAGHRRNAFYTNLPPGEYTFCLSACTEDGVCSQETELITFVFKPGFFESRWFYTALIILTVLSVVVLFRYRVRLIRKREKALQTLVNKRTRDLIKTNNALTEANERRKDVLNTLAHDLKNPVQAILGFSDLIKKKSKNDFYVSEKLDFIRSSGEHMMDMINGILDSAVSENLNSADYEGYLDVSELVSMSAMGYKPLAEKKGQTILVNMRKEMVVKGNPTKIREVFDNLISNAIKYSPYYKVIRINGRSSEDTCIVKVEDEGPGFSEEDKKNLFKPFVKLSSRPTGGEKSVGLGLSIVSRIVENHEGRIRVEPREPSGSIFVVEFPLAAREP